MDGLLFVSLYAVLVLGVCGFNVDTDHPVVLRGSKGSYFGYSVAFLSNKEGELALVTAPKANLSFYDNTVFEPGVLYKCKTTGDTCEEVLLDRTGNHYHSNGPDFSYRDLKNSSWLGVSLDVQEQDPGHIVTCSHLWKNQVYPNHYLLNGACYVLNRDLHWPKKLLPLIERQKQSIIPPGIYYYALAQAGASVTFSEDGKDLIMGAPGLNDWLGSVVEYKVAGHPHQFGRPVVPNPPFNQGLTPESYIGYSVTTGHFYELAGMSYVAGAPRDGANNGRVYIFERLGTTKSKIIVQQKIEGGQLGEYFGASLLSVDLSNNGYSDLLVGSPFYSVKGGGDEGRVYILLSDGVGLQFQKDLFVGSSVPGARFGMAMAKAGDLNQDGYQDVIIGAPYENENGAVYLYHGSKNGLKPEYSQKISGSDLQTPLNGFGISLARSKDIDNNKYPDLLVGAYSSDKAVILRSHPVAQIYPRLDFDIKQVDLNVTQCEIKGRKVTCFTLEGCLKLAGKHIPGTFATLVELWADVSDSQQESFSLNAGSRGGRNQPRGLFMQPAGQTAVPHLREGIVLQKDQETCIAVKVQVLPEDVTDIIQPMTFRMNFSLQATDDKKDFCPGCPVLDPALPTFINKQIHFRTGCGEDNTCSADLNVQAHVVGLKEEEVLIHGANASITVEVRVENAGEPAYASSVSLFLPPDVGVINQAKCAINMDHSQRNSSLDCNLGNPLKRGQPSIFQVKLDISKLDYRSQEMAIKLVSYTASQETNPKDNAILLRVPLRALADITIKGYTDKEQVLYDTKTETVAVGHTYLVLKYYPSPVHSVGVAISVPIFDRNTRVRLVTIETVQVGDSQSSTVPGSCNISSLAVTANALEEQEEALTKGGKDAPNTINLIGLLAPQSSSSSFKDGRSHLSNLEPQNLQETEEGFTSRAQVKQTKSSYIMNCGNSLCQTLTCSVGPFLDNSKVASIQVKLKVNVTAMAYALGNQLNISLVTGGRVWIRDYDYDPQPYDQRPDADEVSTDFITAEPPAKPVELWIIIVAILAGLLLLAIIFLVLYKLGFFKRTTKEEMEKMMQKGALLQEPSEVEEPPTSREVADEFDYINFANANT